MKVNFADGIDIVIDDEKIVEWKHIDEEVVIWVKDGMGIQKVTFDRCQRKFYVSE